MSQAILQFENVSILQEGQATLQNLDIRLSAGDFCYLVGRSGSGKSTFFKAIYGELPIAVGRAEVLGQSLNDVKRSELPYLRRKLGFVFQDFQLLSDRNVEQNLLFVLEATGQQDLALNKTKIQEVLEKVGMVHALHKRIHKLSGGEQQRICIARAIINQPGLLLADEPTGHLDPEDSQEIMALFKKLNQEGTSILMASHDYPSIQKVPGRYLRCEQNSIKEISSLGL